MMAFYEQVNGVAMGSPVSPVIVDIFMESFDIMASEASPYKPTLYKRYVDYTFLVWSHGTDALNIFVEL